MTARDRRAISYLALSLILSAVYEFWPTGGSGAAATADAATVEVAEQRLARLRRIAGTLPAKEEIHKQVAAELAQREKGLIRADTGAQAQAQLITLLTDLGSGEGFRVRPTELRSTVAPLGDAYGRASVGVQFDCRIEQLVNFLAALSAQEQILTTGDLDVNQSDAKQKTLNVRLTVSAVVPRDLVPVKGKQGGGSF